MVGKPLDCCWAFNPTLNELINLAINGELQQTVNARELHSFLESKQDFSTWIKNRIADYDFVENQDFIAAPQKYGAANGGHATRKEYYITLAWSVALTFRLQRPIIVWYN